MQSHFTILSAAIRPEIEERIAIGMLLVEGDTIFFASSKRKLSVVRTLLPSSIYKFLKETLSQIRTTIYEIKSQHNSLYSQIGEVPHQFSYGYLGYTSRYSNNILNFSFPKTIELPSTEVLFNSLFRKYVDESAFQIDSNKEENFEFIKFSFYPRMVNHFNIDQEITDRLAPGLPVPIKVNMSGVNEKPVFAQVVDLERPLYYIQNDVGIISILKEEFPNSQRFLISEEPNLKNFPQQHNTWKKLREWKDADYIDVKDIEMIREYAIEHNVVPLMQSKDF